MFKDDVGKNIKDGLSMKLEVAIKEKVDTLDSIKKMLDSLESIRFELRILEHNIRDIQREIENERSASK